MSACTCPSCGCRLTIQAVDPQQQPRPDRRMDGPQPQRPPRQPAPTTATEAAAYVMPFGKHQGRTLREIDDADPDYLAWALDKFDRDLGRAVALFMGGRQARSQPQDRRGALVAELAAAPAFEAVDDDDIAY